MSVRRCLHIIHSPRFRERSSAVSLSRALAEAADILASIKTKDFTEADIRTRNNGDDNNKLDTKH